jgi:RNA polymerase sigma factor (sigma-70 family)
MAKPITLERLTDEQKQEAENLVSSCVNLIYNRITSWGQINSSDKHRYWDEISSDCMFIALKCALNFNPTSGKFSTYLYKSLDSHGNQMVRRIRRLRRFKPYGNVARAGRIACSSTTPQVEQSDTIELYLSKLEPHTRKVVHMHVIEGLALHEVGERLGITKQAVHQQYTRAMQILRNEGPKRRVRRTEK